MKHFFFIVLILGMFFSFSCKKSKDSYSEVPFIEFKSFAASDKYSAFLVLKFVDGDADLGLKSSDTIGVYDKSSPYYYNLYIKTYYKDNTGAFKDTVIYDLNTNQIDTGLIRQRIQYIPKTTKEDYLKGEFYITLNGYRQSTKHKVVKYKIYIYDRALHKSNVLETPEQIVP